MKRIVPAPLIILLMVGLASMRSTGATAYPTNAIALSQVPLFLTTAIDPNMVVTLDDSSGTTYAYVPDSLKTTCFSCTFQSGKRFASSTYNALYYDPAVIYQAPVDANGNTLTTTFTNAFVDGFAEGKGNVDLSMDYRPTATYDPEKNKSTYPKNSTKQPAYYYVYDPASTGCTAKDINSDSCYRKVVVGANSGIPPHVDERQNFANWFSFYRTRNLSIISAAALSFNHIGENTRIAWQGLTTCESFGTNCKGWSGAAVDNRIARFSKAHRKDFYTWLFRLPASAQTPLPKALKHAGDLYKTSGINSPYAIDPGVKDGTEYACRQNYSVVMTDGMWNDVFVNTQNEDNTARTLPDGAKYSPQPPFRDNNKHTLADVAFHYWATDLRPDLEQSETLSHTPINFDESVTDSVGNIATLSPYWNPKNDPATWQHMITFTVGLGLSAILTDPLYKNDTFAGGYNDVVTGNAIWPQIGSGQKKNTADPARVYDLWHAAIDSRGEFFSADKPNELANAFQTIVSHIQARHSSAATLAANSTSLRSNAVVYQASFQSRDARGDWTGNLQALPIGIKGNIGKTPLWDAQKLLDEQKNWDTGRYIATYASDRNLAGAGKGVPFRWNNGISDAQKTLLLGSDDADTGKARLNYLRGDRSRERRAGGIFRDRTHVLGDIVDSDPLYVGAPNGYHDDPSYRDFVKAHATRPPVIYVGANDGMLHAFDTRTGRERFAFIPGGGFNNLIELTKPGYNANHRLFVDGSPVAGDVKFSDRSWHTILVGGLGSGGNSIYALDLTDPEDITSESALSQKVLWEFTDNKLGKTYSQPAIAQIGNGKQARWVVIFGSGYNNSDARPYLYVVDAETGELVRRIDLCKGNRDACDPSLPNGASTPAVVSRSAIASADTVYVGDLQGNLWRVDISDKDADHWKDTLLFKAEDDLDHPQPITTKPTVSLSPDYPSQGGLLVFIGTGQYLGTPDVTDNATQSLYGIYDRGAGKTVIRSNLVRQTLTTVGASGASLFSRLRTVTTNTVNFNLKDGWRIDLPAAGERIVTAPRLIDGRLLFTSFAPATNPCAAGGTSFLMDLNYATGSTFPRPEIDLNGDGKLDETDQVESENPVGVALGDGYATASTPLRTHQGAIGQFAPVDVSGTAKTVKLRGKSDRRASWRQIR